MSQLDLTPGSALVGGGLVEDAGDLQGQFAEIASWSSALGADNMASGFSWHSLWQTIWRAESLFQNAEAISGTYSFVAGSGGARSSTGGLIDLLTAGPNYSRLPEWWVDRDADDTVDGLEASFRLIVVSACGLIAPGISFEVELSAAHVEGAADTLRYNAGSDDHLAVTCSGISANQIQRHVGAAGSLAGGDACYGVKVSPSGTQASESALQLSVELQRRWVAP